MTNEPICFPYTVPGTTLVIKSLESYDGIFLEDGSDREITGAAAAIIYNEGDTPVEYAVIRLENGEMEFVVTALESGGTVVVQESKAAPYANKEWYECSAEIAYMNEMEMPDGKVAIRETESGALEIRNISDACIPCVRIFYKFYMQEQSLYVGGITYQFKVLTLESGAVKTVTPAHYAAGHSKLIMVKTYDEEN